MYVAFFGYYPIIKSSLEKHLPRVAEWIVKLLIFNAATLAGFAFSTYVLGVPFEEMEEFGGYGIPVLLALANFVFVALPRISAYSQGRSTASTSR